jgi:hypothetical protein
MSEILRTIRPAELPPARPAGAGDDSLDVARRIIDDVRARGWPAAVEWSKTLGDGEPRWHGPARTETSLESLPRPDRDCARVGGVASDRDFVRRTAARAFESLRSESRWPRPATGSRRSRTGRMLTRLAGRLGGGGGGGGWGPARGGGAVEPC